MRDGDSICFRDRDILPAALKEVFMVKKTDADSKGAGKPAEEVQEKKPRRRKPAKSSASGSPENDAGSCLISEGKPNEAQLINEGISAFNCQDYAKARQIFERAYRQHDFRSCYYMGMMALSGNGLPKDEQLAVTYFEEGAKNSCPWSRYQLGVMYRTGTGVPRNLSRGNKYLKDLAQYFADNEGKILLSDPYPETLYFVGQMGVRSKELDKAADLFTRARVFLSQRIAEDYAAPDENDLLLMDNLVAALFRQGEFDVFDIDLFDLMFLFRAGFVEVSFVYKGRLQKVTSSIADDSIVVDFNGERYPGIMEFFLNACFPDGMPLVRVWEQMYLFEVLSIPALDKDFEAHRQCYAQKHEQEERDYEEECDLFIKRTQEAE